MFHRTFLVAAFAVTALSSAHAQSDPDIIYIANNSSSATNGKVTIASQHLFSLDLTTSISRPFGIAVDAFGDVFTSNVNAGTITKIAPNGTATQFATGLTTPRGMSFDSAGNLFVATGTTITEITPGGTASTFDSGYSVAYDVAFDHDGNLYADDFLSATVTKYVGESTSHGLFATVTGGGTTYGLAFDSQDDLFVTENTGQKIVKFTQAGDQSTFATGSSSFNPFGIAIDSNDNVFVSSVNQILEFTPDGTSFGIFASNGIVDPAFIAVPEPSSAALLLLGSLAFVRRRQRVTCQAGR